MDTADPAVDAVLEDLVASTRTVLGADLVAMYLYGSYVSGGFDPGVSDLDLVAVSSSEVEDLDLAGIEQMHRDIIGRYPEWDDRIEVVYIGRATLEAFRTSRGRLAVISPGEPFHVRDDPAAEWVQNWYLVRTTGIALHGPSAEAGVPHVSWPEFAAAATQYSTQLAGRSLRDASPGSVAYAVLTMSRAVMTVRTQTPASKQEGAAWTRRAFPHWAWLVDAALRCRLTRGTVGFADPKTRAAADEFIGLLATEIAKPPA
jgi:predicted nucleotidyltransferase